jgi:hypothetical protein
MTKARDKRAGRKKEQEALLDGSCLRLAIAADTG